MGEMADCRVRVSQEERRVENPTHCCGLSNAYRSSPLEIRGK